MKSTHPEIEKFELDTSLYKRHKRGLVKSDFGLDNSSELIEGGFGLYSTVDLKSRIGPVKTDYYRLTLVRGGTVCMDIG